MQIVSLWAPGRGSSGHWERGLGFQASCKLTRAKVQSLPRGCPQQHSGTDPSILREHVAIEKTSVSDARAKIALQIKKKSQTTPPLYAAPCHLFKLF